MMDPAIGWTQPEQQGPAQHLYSKMWRQSRRHAHKERDPHSNGYQPEFISISKGTVAEENLNYMNLNNRTNHSQREGKDNSNLASTYNLDENMHLIEKYGGMPWRQRHYNYAMGIVGLHQEIQHFYEYMQPLESEENMRNRVVSQIKQIVLRLWPESEVEVFGSFRTKLYLPTSDIDLMVMGKWEVLPLHSLKKELQNSGLCKSITVLDKASVPIVKVIDLESDIRVDISFNTNNGVNSAKLIIQYMKQFPCLAKLVVVLKQYLLQRQLNEVWTGGISSYSLILMVISFLQLHPREDAVTPQANLGVLLLEFFELYGRNFNYMNVAIRVKDGGSYVKKEIMSEQMGEGHRSILCIEDPLNPTNDIGKSSYGAMAVKKAFEHAYLILVQAVGPTPVYTDPSQSILGRIIRVTDAVVKQRKRVTTAFDSGSSRKSASRAAPSASSVIKP